MTPTPIFPVCSHGGLHRGLDHDSARCWTIAHALVVAVEPSSCSEGNRNIAKLARWLAQHPKQADTQQYRDREISLQRWVAQA